MGRGENSQHFLQPKKPYCFIANKSRQDLPWFCESKGKVEEAFLTDNNCSTPLGLWCLKNIIQPVYQMGLALRSHICSEKDFVREKKCFVQLSCWPCVWGMCGEPRLAFCGHLSLKSSQLVHSKSSCPTGEPLLAPHLGTHGATPFFSFSLSSPAAVPASPANPAFLPFPFVPPPKPAIRGSDAVCSRQVSQEMPSQSFKLSVCVSV